MSQERALDEKKTTAHKPDVTRAPEKRQMRGGEAGASGVLRLQQQAGNRAVQRLLAQRSGDGSFALDEETAGRINRARGGGQPLDAGLQRQMGPALGHDLSGVRVHTSPESDELNQQLNAKAFTTGQDVFIRQGDYNPDSSGGRELIAHELSHVVQQSSGRVGGGGGGMTVRPAGDAFEQEADAQARQATGTVQTPSAGADAGGVQRQEEEEIQAKGLQRQAEEEEEPVQMQALQRQEEEEEVQLKPLQRQEEEEIQAKALQRQEEEEEVQLSPLQRQEEEEEVQAKAVQRQAEEEEEPVQMEAVQRQEEEELET
jgi:hypothetical protein